MDSPVPDPRPGVPSNGVTEVDFEVRTAPKLWPFLGSGFVLGAVVALIVAWFSHAANVEAAAGGPVEFSFGAVFGFFLILFGIVGVGVGALAFLLMDRMGRRNARVVHAVAEPVTDQTLDTEA